MEGLIRGDIVIINFPFTNLREAKRRPALVIKVIDSEDLILCQITSKFKKDPNRIFTLHKELVLKKTGRMKSERINEVLHKITSFLQSD